MRRILGLFVLALVVSGCKSQRIVPEHRPAAKPKAAVVVPVPYKAPEKPLELEEVEDCPDGMCPIRK